MAPGTIRKALGAVKDQTSIGLAKVGGSSMASELDVAIVKATRHDEFPAEERYVREILSLTRYARLHVSNCVSSISRRLGKTNSWSVALKALILVHRLLNEGDSSFEQEVFFATRCGTRMLNMSDFRDKSRSDAWDFSAFVRTYAMYLDERLEYRMQGQKHRSRSLSAGFIRDDSLAEVEAPMGDYWDGKDREREHEKEEGSSSAIVLRGTPVREMKIESLFGRVKTLQNLLERFLACRPTGAAKSNRVVNVALFLLLKESFQLYFEMQELIGVFVDRFADLEIPECVRVHTVFSRLAKQLDELDAFYSWCKSASIILRPSEFPDVELISSRKLQLMDDFIRQKSSGNYEEKVTSRRNSNTNIERKVEEEYDMNAVKALPAPEPEPAPKPEPTEPVHQPEPEPVPVPEPEPQPNNLQVAVVQEEVDLLNLKDDAVTTEEHGDKLALALFDRNLSPKTAPAWQPFEENSADWENVLVQSASSLTAQKPALGGGLDMMTLNGMYGHAHANAATTQLHPGYGSASSVVMHAPALPGPQMLALPAPPVTGPVAANGDPFAASLTIPAPSYVQMSDLEKKQRFLMEEQMAWHQYAKNGMQGQAGFARLQQQQQQQYGSMGGYNIMY